MKTLKSILMVSMALTVCGLATAHASPGDPKDTAEEIAAQANVTRDAIEHVLRNLRRADAGESFQAADYWEQLPEYSKRVEEGLTEFQNQVTNVILPKLAFWMDRYNSVYESKQFSGDQKKVLLNQQLQVIRGQVKLLTGEYQAAIRSVYAILGDAFPYSFELKLHSRKSKTVVLGHEKSAKQLYRSLDCDRSKSAYISLLIFRSIKNELLSSRQYCASRHYDNSGYPARGPYYQLSVPAEQKGKVYKLKPLSSEGATALTSEYYHQEIFPMIAGSCRSQVCLGMRAGDLSHLLGLIKTSIDRPITVRLADEIHFQLGTPLTLENLDLNIDVPQFFLQRIDYPAEVYQSWPFDTP